MELCLITVASGSEAVQKRSRASLPFLDYPDALGEFACMRIKGKKTLDRIRTKRSNS
jgi:hypothetical protein